MTTDHAPGFAVFRRADALPEHGIPIMRRTAMSDVVMAGGARMMAAGVEQGHENRLLFSAPGFSLAYAWFKSGYPLPRHTHDGGCLYYILAGGLRIGTEALGAGDGFFVGADVPYAYTAGPDGVEILEFRAADAFDIKLLANNPAFWDKATAIVNERRETWRDEPRPSDAHRGDQE
jgi:quercetin dioxygenase-like cupin family protein